MAAVAYQPYHSYVLTAVAACYHLHYFGINSES